MSRWARSPIIRLGILLLPSLIVLTCVAITFSIAVAVQDRSLRDATAERVSDVARSLAQLEQVRSALREQQTDSPDSVATASETLQPLADLVERASGVDYVVIANSQAIRITHPTPNQRGQRVSTDHSAVLQGEEFLGTEEGTLGPTLRAKVPIHDGNAVIGTVSVGILESRIAAELNDALSQLLPWTLGALLLGTVASSLLSGAFARRLRRFEEIGIELEQQRRTATALREQTHEFHTRMHVIHGLVSHGDTAEALSYVERIAPLHSGSAATEIDTHPMLRAVIDALAAELRAAGATLDIDLAVTNSVDDEVLLVIANLCRNAGESGARRVHLSLTESAAGLRGTVEDDGPGVPPALRERIFSRGVTSKHDVTGTGRGIGLDLVRRIVVARRGTIELGTSTWGGSRFEFELPVEERA